LSHTSIIKPPEEGDIWEWRAFGRIDERLRAKVESYPVRAGIKALCGEDIYFVSCVSDQNVKLRKSGSEWLLKFKLLLATERQALELYSETAASIFRFPVRSDMLREAARLLQTNLPEDALSMTSFTDEEFARALAGSSPAVTRVEVSKVRSQFQFDGGWIEMADVVFKRGRVQTISIHSNEVEVVEKMVERLGPGAELEVMNYVQACRRWS
jgi:hypothetical protein